MQQAWNFAKQVRTTVDQERNKQAEERNQAWTEWSRREWTASGKKEIYRFCQSTHQGTIPVLQQSNGQLTGDYARMDVLLREKWDTTFNLYASIPRPTWDAFQA